MKKLAIIQGLRAVAANLVIVSHLFVIEQAYGHGFIVLPDAEILGRLGVLLFFVISGFVMSAVASRATDWRPFLWARMTRIYPAYWLYTALLLLCASLAPGTFILDSTTSLLRSLALVPDNTLPLLRVGWSLVYEVYFYLVFAFFLATGINLLAGLLGWSLVLLLPISPVGPISAVALDPIAFNFIGGALLWIGLARLQVRLPDLRLGLLERLGDASYSTYLGHPFVLAGVGMLFAAQPWHSWIAEGLFIITCIVSANAVGWLSYRYLERPLIEMSRHIGARQPAMPHPRQGAVS